MEVIIDKAMRSNVLVPRIVIPRILIAPLGFYKGQRLVGSIDFAQKTMFFHPEIAIGVIAGTYAYNILDRSKWTKNSVTAHIGLPQIFTALFPKAEMQQLRVKIDTEGKLVSVQIMTDTK